MKNNALKKTIVVFFTVTLFMALSVYANVVGTEILDGVVISTYSDGTKRAVDTDGTVYTLEKDGLSRAYYTDGSVMIEKPDGTKTLVSADGSMVSIDINENYAITDKHGITQTFDSDYNPQSMYFEDGEGVMNYDVEKGTFVGETTDKNGLKLECDGDNVKLELEGSFTLEGSNIDGEIKMDFSDSEGNSINIGNGDATIRIADGGLVTINDNGYEMTCGDGSYIKANESVYESFDAETKAYVFIDSKNGQIEMDYYDGGVHTVCKNGEWEITDTETGDVLLVHVDGTVERKDGDGDGDDDDDDDGDDKPIIGQTNFSFVINSFKFSAQKSAINKGEASLSFQSSQMMQLNGEANKEDQFNIGFDISAPKVSSVNLNIDIRLESTFRDDLAGNYGFGKGEKINFKFKYSKGTNIENIIDGSAFSVEMGRTDQLYIYYLSPVDNETWLQFAFIVIK